MQGIRDRVAIIGMGCTRFGERWNMDLEDLLSEAAYEAYQDAGIGPEDIQAAWFGSRRAFTGQPVARALKFDCIPISRVENACASGTDAFRNACYAVAAGAFDLVMVAGAEKLKDSGFTGLARVDTTAGTGVQPAAGPPVTFALRATRYAHTYGLSYDDLKRTLGKIAVKNHKNGAKNPKAHLRREVTLEQVLNAPPVAWPLGLYDCCGVSDGAGVAIICRAEIAQRFRKDYVLVRGLGLSSGKHDELLSDEYDFVHFPESVAAARMAYADAGIRDPLHELDVAAVHDCFTITEAIIYEDLGFCPRGKAPEYVDTGVFTLEGELPVNTDGGLKCFGHPVGATGIRMIYEVYKQIQGKALGYRLKDVRTGLTHNIAAEDGSFVCGITILGRPD